MSEESQVPAKLGTPGVCGAVQAENSGGEDSILQGVQLLLCVW